MTHWKKLTNPNYIGSYELEPGKDLTVTIVSVAKEMVMGPDGREEECIVAKLAPPHKPFILNRTNCKSISKVAGSSQIEDWGGKQIVLYVAKVKAFGELVEALRVRPPVALPELTPAHPQWTKAIEYFRANKNLDTILKRYTISPVNLVILSDEANKPVGEVVK